MADWIELSLAECVHGGERKSSAPVLCPNKEQLGYDVATHCQGHQPKIAREDDWQLSFCCWLRRWISPFPWFVLIMRLLPFVSFTVANARDGPLTRPSLSDKKLHWEASSFLKKCSDTTRWLVCLRLNCLVVFPVTWIEVADGLAVGLRFSRNVGADQWNDDLQDRPFCNANTFLILITFLILKFYEIKFLKFLLNPNYYINFNLIKF